MELLSTLGIDWKVLIAQIINFLILLAILTKLVYKPLLNLLDQRADRVRKAMDNASDMEQQAKRAEEEHRDRLRQADAAAGEILQNAKKQAEAMQQEVLAKAKHEAEAIIARGNQLIADERTKALADVQDTVTKVIVQLTESLLRREFSADDQKRISKEISQKIPSLIR